MQSADDPSGGEMPSSAEEYEHMLRSIKYTFPAEFLDYKTVRTMCVCCPQLVVAACPHITQSHHHS